MNLVGGGSHSSPYREPSNPRVSSRCSRSLPLGRGWHVTSVRLCVELDLIMAWRSGSSEVGLQPWNSLRLSVTLWKARAPTSQTQQPYSYPHWLAEARVTEISRGVEFGSKTWVSGNSGLWWNLEVFLCLFAFLTCHCVLEVMSWLCF